MDKEEVEVVDMILRILQKLEKSYLDDVPLKYSVQEMLQERINEITQTLPEDLRLILNKESWQYYFGFALPNQSPLPTLCTIESQAV